MGPSPGGGLEKICAWKKLSWGVPPFGDCLRKKNCRIKLVALGIFFCMVQILWGKLVNVSTLLFVTLLTMNSSGACDWPRLAMVAGAASTELLWRWQSTKVVTMA